MFLSLLRRGALLTSIRFPPPLYDIGEEPADGGVQRTVREVARNGESPLRQHQHLVCSSISVSNTLIFSLPLFLSSLHSHLLTRMS
jgi:hypothetical protein